MEGQGGEAGSGTLLVLDPKPFKPFKSKDEYLYAMKEDLSEWFYCLYRIDISVENFFEVLETGVILCDHAVSVQNFAREKRIRHTDLELRSYFIREIPDGGIPCKHGVKPKTFQARDNISNFITWCRKLGIPQVLLFETDDLVLRKNERSVVLCLLEVARIGAKLGMLAPVLVQMEEEIDAELAGEPPPQIKTCDLRSLDEMVRELVGRCTCPAQFPIIQMGDGKYKIGDSQTLIFVRILRNHVMVRVGGGWDTLENYLDKHDPCRCGFRGHRNTPSSAQYGKSQPQVRRTSAPNVQQSKSQTPRSNRSMSVAGPNVAPNMQNSEYMHMRSPSPERTVRQKLPPRVSLGSLGNISERSASSNVTSRQTSSNISNSTPHKDSVSARSYSPITFRGRSHSPSPIYEPKSSNTRQTYADDEQGQTRSQYRTKSPGPIPRPSAVNKDTSLDPSNRPKTPINRCKSPGIPRPVLTSRAQSPDPTPRPKTPVYRSKSPGPVQKSSLLTRAESPEPSPRPKTPVHRSKSPGPGSKSSLLTRAESPEPSLRPKTPVHRSKSPGPGTKSSLLTRTESPEPGLRWAIPSSGRAKSPGPLSNSLGSRPMSPENRYICKSPLSVRRAAPVERVIARVNRQETRPESPANRSKSPGPIPRSRIPRSKSPFLLEPGTSTSTDKHRRGSIDDVCETEKDPDPTSTLPGTQPNSDEMDTSGDINIDRISTMTLSEFKHLLSTSLSVPNGSTTVSTPESPRSQGNVKSSNAKSSPNRSNSGFQKKPPASPRRTKSTASLPETENCESNALPQDRQRRALPQSPESTSPACQGLHTGFARQTSTDKLSTASSSSELSRGTEPASPTEGRPSTPSSFTRLPRPKTPSGIPRPSTPTNKEPRAQGLSGDAQGEKPRKQLPRPSNPYRAETPRRSQTPESMSEGVLVRHRSPSPTARAVLVNGSQQRQVSEPEEAPDPLNSKEASPESAMVASESQSSQQAKVCNDVVRKPSRLRPPSPSRLPLTMRSVEVEADQPANRGRSASRTYLEQFRKRPSSAGPTVIASRYTQQKTQNTNDEVIAADVSGGGTKKYFGRKNAKTIIKANSALAKAKSIQNIAISPDEEETGSKLIGKCNASEASTDDRSRSRTRSEGFQIRQRPKSAGPRPLVRQDAEDRSIIVNRRGAGQHSITITTGEKRMYESREKHTRPTSAKTSVPKSVICSSTNSTSERGRSRVVSKSVDLTQMRYRPKSAGPRSASPVSLTETNRNSGSTGVREKVSNRYVSTGNLVRAWEEKNSDRVTGARRQLPQSPRKCLTPAPGNKRESRPLLHTRSVTPNPSDDHELLSRSLSEIKAALQLPINGVSKIEVDPSKLAAPPEDPVMYQKMEELFQKYREKELNGGDNDSASTTSEDVDKGQGSADDEASVDSNANIKSKLRNCRSDSAITDLDDCVVNESCDLESVRFETSVVAQLSEILKPSPRKEPNSGIKCRIPAPQSRVRSKSVSALQNGQYGVQPDVGSNGINIDFMEETAKTVDCKPSVNCVNSQLSFKQYESRNRLTCSGGEENPLYNSNSDLHREDSSTSLSDISLSSSQGGFRSETPVPKLATPLCTGRSTLFNTRKERSSSVSSTQGTSTTRLVRAVSLDHSFTSTGNSIPDTSFSLAEDEEYV